ncbi:5'-methylthioadenosine/adenosylhomocysteine nucleosidase [Paraburkholderia hayleyella]|uniref:5'-methylthioadenosine/adenosylhomocysteine nucleosidase n=1 Tax=Paraburkholderia hayleyella TaxID=2152889 RepID=UPI0012921048|nr:5'-methylthioadenosine/adenosylhomocysteine nucleosidase [Paraburkholderia hayleyella]
MSADASSAQPTRPRRLGLLAALPEELGDLVAAMHASGGVESVTLGQRVYHLGTLSGVPCVVALVRIGKVAAAATVSALIHVFEVDAVVLTGVAGGVGDGVQVGDVVLAEALLQHDLDASPLFARFEVPLLGQARFAADPGLTAQLAAACEQFLAQEGAALALRFGTAGPSELSGTMRRPQLHRGLILSGDQFIASAHAQALLREALPDALAVEMEGAAIAQVCYEHGVRCAVLRTVSDRADAAAPDSFETFLGALAGAYSNGILQRFLQAWA